MTFTSVSEIPSKYEPGISVSDCDRVQLVLDKELSPDNQLHGEEGEIKDIDFDDASSITGNHDDNFQYSVELDSGEELNMHFRRHDLKKVEQKT